MTCDLRTFYETFPCVSGSYIDSHTPKLFTIFSECLKCDNKLTFKVKETLVHPFLDETVL